MCPSVWNICGIASRMARKPLGTANRLHSVPFGSIRFHSAPHTELLCRFARHISHIKFKVTPRLTVCTVAWSKPQTKNRQFRYCVVNSHISWNETRVRNEPKMRRYRNNVDQSKNTISILTFQCNAIALEREGFRDNDAIFPKIRTGYESSCV